MPAVIEVTPATLSPEATQGTAPQDDTLTVTNTGERVLQLQVTTDADWLSVSPDAADIPPGTSEAATLVVSYDTASLEPGDYAGTITLSDPDAANSPQVVPVYLTVTSSGGCTGGSSQGTSRAPAGFLLVTLGPLIAMRVRRR